MHFINLKVFSLKCLLEVLLMILFISLKKVKKHNFFLKIAIYYKIPYIYNFRRKKYLNKKLFILNN